MDDKQTSATKDLALVWAEQQEEKRVAFEREQEQKRQSFEQKLEEGKARRDWMMLIITFAAVTAAYWTGWEARHARMEARDAADRSFQAQVVTMQLDERPYLKPVFQTIRSYGLEPTNKTIAILASREALTGYGRTPALNIRVYSRCTPAPQTVLLIDEPRDGALPLVAEVPFLSPGDTSNPFGCSIDRPVNSHDAINSYGTIFYDDMFHVPHLIQFCWTVVYDQHTGHTVNSHPCENVLLKIT